MNETNKLKGFDTANQQHQRGLPELIFFYLMAPQTLRIRGLAFEELPQFPKLRVCKPEKL
jgi:hypothetical protein